MYLGYRKNQHHHGCIAVCRTAVITATTTMTKSSPTRGAIFQGSWRYRSQIWPPGTGTDWLSQSSGPTHSTSISVRVTLTTCRLRVLYPSIDRWFRWIGYCAAVSRHGRRRQGQAGRGQRSRARLHGGHARGRLTAQMSRVHVRDRIRRRCVAQMVTNLT